MSKGYNLPTAPLRVNLKKNALLRSRPLIVTGVVPAPPIRRLPTVPVENTLSSFELFSKDANKVPSIGVVSYFKDTIAVRVFPASALIWLYPTPDTRQ